MTRTPDISVALPAEPAAPARGRRELLAATVGSAVETFDWAIYAVMAPFFASQMFPGEDEVTKVLAAYAGFAVAFIVRPLGSVVLGRVADVRGRRFVLMVSMFTICLGSLLIAALPTAAAVGVAAPVLLLLLRAVQGFALGGEGGSVAAYISETAPENRRFLFSGLSYCGVIIGNLLCFLVAGVLLAVMGRPGVVDGGWRIAFVIGGVLAILAFWVRRTAAESGEFEKARLAANRPKLSAQLRNMAAVFLMTTGMTVGTVFGTTYLPEFAVQAGAAPAANSNLIMVPSLVVLIAAMIGAGILGDRFGGMRVFRIGLVLLALCTVPLMTALMQGLLPVWLVASLFLALGVAPGLALAHVLCSGGFPVEIRAVCMGLPATLAIALFGGTLPLVAQSLVSAGHLAAVPWIPAGAAVIGLVGTAIFRRN